MRQGTGGWIGGWSRVAWPARSLNRFGRNDYHMSGYTTATPTICCGVRENSGHTESWPPPDPELANEERSRSTGFDPRFDGVSRLLLRLNPLGASNWRRPTTAEAHEPVPAIRGGRHDYHCFYSHTAGFSA